MRANADMPIVIRQGGIVTADSERRNHIVRELVLSGKLKALTATEMGTYLELMLREFDATIPLTTYKNEVKDDFRCGIDGLIGKRFIVPADRCGYIFVNLKKWDI